MVTHNGTELTDTPNSSEKSLTSLTVSIIPDKMSGAAKSTSQPNEPIKKSDCPVSDHSSSLHTVSTRYFHHLNLKYSLEKHNAIYHTLINRSKYSCIALYMNWYKLQVVLYLEL
jgi:hypothetical protein